ncbi:MAG: hypothetical protein K1X94_01410 [Sandaracinaceae bacterium]|nr:hypothetical protein [Sandaracinaceae bacterium]
MSVAPLPERPRILFVGCSLEDYLADSLLHGLNALLGAAVVDVPRVDHLYRGFPHLPVIYGRGFSLYGRAPDAHPLRARYEHRLGRGEFDLLVFANVHRTPGELVRLLPLLGSTRVALLDGEDDIRLFPRGAALLEHPALLRLRFDRRWLYFKREWAPDAPLSARWKAATMHPLTPPRDRIRPASFSIPSDVLVPEGALHEGRTQDFPHHIVDAEVAARLGRQTKYAFSDEAAYHADLAASRFGITTKRAGWDCLRHYEIAARGAIPCVRALSSKPSTCAPHGLDASNCIDYTSYDDLVRRIAALSPERERALREGAYAWARRNTTVEAAKRFLDVVRAG